MDTTPIFLLLFNFPTCPKILSSEIIFFFFFFLRGISSEILGKKVNNLCFFITRVAFGNLDLDLDLSLDLKLIDLKITLILEVI